MIRTAALSYRAGVDGEVHRRNDHAGGIKDRSGDGAQTHLELPVDERVALPAGVLKFGWRGD